MILKKPTTAIALLLMTAATFSCIHPKDKPELKPDPQPEVKVANDGTLTEYPEELIPENGEVTLADNVTKIASKVFNGSAKLKKLVAPKVTTIEDNALVGAAVLESIKLPLVEQIGTKAFSGAKVLASAELGEKVPKVGEGAFADTPDTKQLTVPTGSEKEYKDWGDLYQFASINEQAFKLYQLEGYQGYSLFLEAAPYGNNASYVTYKGQDSKLFGLSPLGEFTELAVKDKDGQNFDLGNNVLMSKVGDKIYFYAKDIDVKDKGKFRITEVKANTLEVLRTADFKDIEGNNGKTPTFILPTPSGEVYIFFFRDAFILDLSAKTSTNAPADLTNLKVDEGFNYGEGPFIFRKNKVKYLSYYDFNTKTVEKLQVPDKTIRSALQVSEELLFLDCRGTYYLFSMKEKAIVKAPMEIDKSVGGSALLSEDGKRLYFVGDNKSTGLGDKDKVFVIDLPEGNKESETVKLTAKEVYTAPLDASYAQSGYMKLTPVYGTGQIALSYLAGERGTEGTVRENAAVVVLDTTNSEQLTLVKRHPITQSIGIMTTLYLK